MSDIFSDFQFAANVFVKMYHLQNEGDIIEGHAHTFDHITLLAAGAVKMEARGNIRDIQAPCLIITPEKISHKFTATSPNTIMCCIHAIRDGDGIDDIAPQNISREEAMGLFNKYTVMCDPCM